MNEDWTELYRPNTLNEVLGNPKAVKELRDWAISWESGAPTERAVVIMGPPGIGKTSTALALAREFNWGVVEMNASDQRNAEAIKKVAIRGALSESFSDSGEFLSSKEGRHKLIILDEADNIFGREDFGGVPVIAELIRTTKQPVVLIVNDFYELSRRSSAIKSETRQIKFTKLQAVSIRSALKRVAIDQGVNVDESVLFTISEKANGDMRAALRDLQAASLGNPHVKDEAITGLADRSSRKSMYDLMGDILHGTNPKRARETNMETGEDPDFTLKWLDENVSLEYKDPDDLFRAYVSLSRADIFLTRVQRRQYYGFWAYANMHMTYGVNLAKSKPYRSYVRYNFPLMLMRLSRSKEARGVKAEVATKLGMECHASKKQVVQDILPYFKELFQKNRDFRIGMTIQLGLEQEEMAFLLEQKVDAAAVKHLVQEVQAQRARSDAAGDPIDDSSSDKRPAGKKKKKVSKAEPEPEPEPVVKTVVKVEGRKETVKDEPKAESKGRQRSLFDF